MSRPRARASGGNCAPATSRTRWVRSENRGDSSAIVTALSNIRTTPPPRRECRRAATYRTPLSCPLSSVSGNLTGGDVRTPTHPSWAGPLARRPLRIEGVAADPRVRPEPDAGSRVAAAEAEGGAVGPPAGRAGQRAVRLEADRAHAPADVGDRRDVMAAGGEGPAHAVRDGAFDLQLLALRPDARRLDRLLQRHPVVDHVHEGLEHRGEDPHAARQAERPGRPPLAQHDR